MPGPARADALPVGPLNILLIGGGGREHALAIQLARSPRCRELYTTHPENPGIAALATPVGVPASIREIYRLQQYCEKTPIHLAVIGPEQPLAEGYADKLREAGVVVFGPSAEGARLEADKAWAKQLMRGASIPTAESRAFTDPEAARQYLESRVFDDDAVAGLVERSHRFRDPVERRRFIDEARRQDRTIAAAYDAKRPDLHVVKASGLAAGKGVVVPDSLAHALDAVDAIMVRRAFGEAGRQVVIEERLTGPEVSLLAITDGSTILLLPPAQDHKRLGDGDTGPNTGGMGAFCPSPLLSGDTLDLIERDILVPAVDALKREGIRYVGVLYAGLMLTHAGPKVLEFNCRFGDPECQSIMARLKSDLVELLLKACTGRLDEAEVEWDPSPACCVVLASRGYPDKPRLGVPIRGVEQAEAIPGITVTHAGTRRAPDGTLVTGGGRVLGVTGVGPTLEAARAKAYAACDLIKFESKILRTDIGAPR